MGGQIPLARAAKAGETEDFVLNFLNVVVAEAEAGPTCGRGGQLVSNFQHFQLARYPDMVPLHFTKSECAPPVREFEVP